MTPLFLIAVIILIISFALFLRSILILRGGRTAEGVVVGLIEDDEDSIFAPIVRFRAEPGGRLVEFQHSIYQKPPYRIGARVSVIYREDKPEAARINSFVSLFMMPVILGLIGAVMFFAAFFVSFTE